MTTAVRSARQPAATSRGPSSDPAPISHCPGAPAAWNHATISAIAASSTPALQTTPLSALECGPETHREAVAELRAPGDGRRRDPAQPLRLRGPARLGVGMRRGGRRVRLRLLGEPRRQLRRGLAGHVGLHPRAGRHQPLGDPEVVGAAAGDRPGEWNEPCAVQPSAVPPMPGSARRSRVLAAREQQLDHVAMPPPGGVVQRRPAHLARPSDPGAQIEQDLNGGRATLRGGLVDRLEGLAPQPLGPLGILAREPQRALAVAGEAEPDQLVDRPDLAARAHPASSSHRSSRPMRQARPYGRRLFASS